MSAVILMLLVAPAMMEIGPGKEGWSDAPGAWLHEGDA